MPSTKKAKITSTTHVQSHGKQQQLIHQPVGSPFVLVLGALAVILPRGVVQRDGHGQSHVHQGGHQLQGGQSRGVTECTNLARKMRVKEG